MKNDGAVKCVAPCSYPYTLYSSVENSFSGIDFMLLEPEQKESAQKKRMTKQGRPEVLFNLLSANTVCLEKWYETQKMLGCHPRICNFFFCIH